jgi:Domain of unknown function (DUF4382)
MLRKPFWLAGAMALTLAACGDDDESNPVTPPGTTSVSVLLTDAPGDILQAVVTVDEVFLQNAGSDKVNLLDAPATVNLTDLANTTSELLAEASAPNAAYSDLRFVISGGFIRVENEDGSETIFATSPDYAGLPAGATVGGALQLPSEGTSGLKVDFAQPIELTGGTASLLVDFDVSESFGQEAGGSGQWVMHPVIKGATASQAATVEFTLALGADVTLPEGVTLGNFTAQLGSEKVAFTDAGGTFKATFLFVLPGSYTLTILGPAGFDITTDPGTPLDVTVGGGGTVTQAFTLSSITPTP